MLIRLLVGFLTVIVLLMSFNYLSFTFFQNNIRNEIIRYNAQNIRFTSERYEEHFQLVQKQMYALYFHDDVNRLQKASGNARFELLDRVKQEIVKVVGNPLIYVDNAIIVFKEGSLTLSRNGTNDRVAMFEKFYASRDYPDAFWQKQFNETYASKLFPMSMFYEHAFHQSGDATFMGRFIPYIVKHWQNDDFYLVAMLDADKLFDAFHRSVNSNFVILDKQGELLFATGGAAARTNLPNLPAGKTYFLHDNTYYFYQTGANSGFTYLNIIPGASISEQVSKLNLTLIVLLVLALIVSIVVSVLFSVRFNRPVKRLVTSLQMPGGEDLRFKSNIREFELIGQKLDDMLQANARIQSDLAQKNIQLMSYDYLNKLKKIYSGSRGSVDIVSTQEYRFVVYEVTYKDRFWEEMREEPGPLTYSIYTYINHSLLQVFPASLTIQVESLQMLSVINEIDDERFEAYLSELLKVVAHDADFYFLTIALSPAYPQSFDFTVAYEQTVKLLKERKLNEDTQIVREPNGRPAMHRLTAAQEQQFDSNLAAGNTQELLHLLDRQLAIMERKCETLLQYQEFLVDIVQKVRKSFHTLRLDERALQPIISGLNTGQSFYSGKHYRKFFSQLLVAACEEIRRNQKNGDPVIDFVFDYVSNNYTQDISLDILAEHLHITGGYLSTYFKEKTGENFIDYVNGVRVGIAQQLLLETDLRIQDVASRAGYQNINSFNRMFKKFTGVSPREFRKEKRTEEEE
ncbi:helix-turn-helix domain-containing protein [Bacillus sp. 3255]|uniref:helix-turn-helix domain-containing protein n=1 Tax=Bacillus sp. 3255 TaxID=2817904 RepID=UPI0028615031|nr:helix-turn-helix domain-containing protein [Bacillus sp. 3255]MDR6882212.1 AraC-like DNA-binding protein [Bacillus sp. 3255]